MLNRLILDHPVPDLQAAVITREGSTTWASLRGQAESFLQTYPSLGRRRIGISFRPAAESYAAAAAMDRLECDLFLLDSRLPKAEALELSRKLKLGAFLIADENRASPLFEICELPGEEKWSGSSSVTILTSGSTGTPKAARHTWDSIARPVRKGTDNQAPRWLLTYRPNLYAGLQVMIQCFTDRGTLTVAEPEMDPQATAQLMLASRVQYVSATPSFWRRLLMFADPQIMKNVGLKQITLGGEVVDQAILDRISRFFPGVRLVHIYATTELGRCFSVKDGIAGFPADYLDTPLADRVEMTVREGELVVRSPNSMRMYDPQSSQPASVSDWFPTGDLVDVKDGRVHFVGRRSDMINVAGSKVYPVEVERVIRVIPGVSDVRVFGKSSSIAGELVACEIVPEAGQDPQVLKDSVIRVCRADLASHQQPRMIKIVDRIELSPAGKTLRTRIS